MAPQVEEMPRVDGAQAAPANQRPASPPMYVPGPQRAPYPLPPVHPPYAWMPPEPARPFSRYAGYRLALAIFSLALFIPLSAIALGAASSFNATLGDWLGALAIIGAALLGVNIAFSLRLASRRP
jgi:hypothetical protein